MKRAIYAGSFDPITNGHIDIIRRGCKVFDKIYVVLMENTKKVPLFSVEERKRLIEESIADLGEKVDIYGTYGSKYISRPLKEAKLVDGSSMIYNIGDYHDGNGIAVKDGKIRLSCLSLPYVKSVKNVKCGKKTVPFSFRDGILTIDAVVTDRIVIIHN